MASFHRATFELLGTQPRVNAVAIEALERTERRLGFRLPRSVREWYSYQGSLSILAKHSNADPPIPLSEFAVTESATERFLPIRWENQGVCTWAILLDDSDDPPVFVDVDSDGARWQCHAPTLRCASMSTRHVCVAVSRSVLKHGARGTSFRVPCSAEP
jgi:hypothetical protein